MDQVRIFAGLPIILIDISIGFPQSQETYASK
jgi:hypothetical protein